MRNTGKYLNELWEVSALHALYREDGKWYHQLKRFPGALFDINGYIIFNSQDAYINSQYLQKGKDLHVPDGISQIPGYVQVIHNMHSGERTIDVSNSVIRKKREVTIIVRNQQFVQEIKQLYQNKCQICGFRLKVYENHYYSEVHHIKPVGKPHNGQDVKENMICVCVNHHVLLDLGGIKLDTDELSTDGTHKISKEYVKYHNEKILNNHFI